MDVDSILLNILDLLICKKQLHLTKFLREFFSFQVQEIRIWWMSMLRLDAPCS